MACVNQNSIWETCSDTDATPCDDTVLTWLHTLNREWLEVVANLLLGQLAMTILDPDRSRIVSIDFIDNPYHGDHYMDEGELCSMAPKDGTTTCHRYCTAYVVSNGKPVTLAMTYVRNDEDETDAVERILDRVENYRCFPKNGGHERSVVEVVGFCAESPSLVRSLLNDALDPNAHRALLLERVQHEPFGPDLA